MCICMRTDKKYSLCNGHQPEQWKLNNSALGLEGLSLSVVDCEMYPTAK